MAVRTSDLTSADWSPKVGSPGEVVTELDDIDQCIAIILTTRKGSDPHRPLFGCDAWLWIDKPANVAMPNIILEAVDSLEEWEPRMDLVSIKPQINGSQITILVEWQPKGEDYTKTSEVRLDTTS